MTDVSQTAKIDAEIDKLFPEAIELLQAVVRQNSINPLFPGIDRDEVIGGEAAVGLAFSEFMSAYGFDTELVAVDAERPNTVMTLKGQGGGKSLIINGHVDTVAPFHPEEWKNGDPWSGVIEDGRLYGLGSTDMKGGIVAAMLAAASLRKAGIEMKGDLQIHAVVGEETMSHELGTTAVLEAGHTADAAIVVEATSSPVPLSIANVSAGNFNLQIDVRGYATHSGNRGASIRAGGAGNDAGVNAVEKAILVIQALQQLEQEWGITKSHPSFPAGLFSLAPGVFHGDAGVPSVGYLAEQATIGYLVWYPPNEDPEAIKAEIEKQVMAAAQLDSWLRDHPPVLRWDSHWPVVDTPEDHALVRQMVTDRADVLGAPAPGVPDTTGFLAVCDAAFLQAQGVPTVVFGPGNLRQAHAVNEFVELDEILNCARVLARTMIGWCDSV